MSFTTTKNTIPLLAALLLAPLTALHAADATQSNGKAKPNIVFIVAEDLGRDMGCYGTKGVHTPNLDRLAAEGIRFTKAFHTASVCSPCRSSFMTGMYPTQVYSQNMRIHPPLVKHALPAGVNIFTKYLRDAGYAIGLCNYQKMDWGFEKPVVTPYDTNDWDQLVQNQPFFCQFQFSSTHRPFRPCKEHPVDRSRIELPPYVADVPEAREEQGQYLENINLLDMELGDLIEKLKAAGCYEDTVIVFIGDNGPPTLRGKGFLYDLGIAMPLIVRAPERLLPGFAPGAVSEELVSSLDVAPTFIDLAGGKSPSSMEGRIFLGKNKQPALEYVFAQRDRHDLMIDRVRSVRSRQFKYIRNFQPHLTHYATGLKNVEAAKTMKKLFERNTLPPEQAGFFQPRAGEELYDLSADPFELQNLVGTPDYAKILGTMRGALQKWIVDTGDDDRLKEDPEAVAESYRRFEEEVKSKRGKRKGISDE